MQIIQNNPYRIVGLLVGATAAEQKKQLTRLQRFLEAEQTPEDNYSFPALGKLHRTLESVGDASSKLNLDSDKMAAALFWFYKGNDITDEPAFDALKDGNIDEALAIWSKMTASASVTQRNASAYSNLATLYLSTALLGTGIQLEKGITLKLKFLESDFTKDFKGLATDETYKTTQKQVQLSFLQQIQTEIEKSKTITIDKFLKILTQQDFLAKADFLKVFVQKPIEEIEKQIAETNKKQEANKAKAGDYGNELYKSIQNPLKSLTSILGKSDSKVISISDKIANELLQCSITLFNHFHDTGTEVGEQALALNKKAASIALGNGVRERINESTPVVEEYISHKDERQKFRLIKNDINFIHEELDPSLKAVKNEPLEPFSLNRVFSSGITFGDNPHRQIVEANTLFDNCKPRLIKIKQNLGVNNELYLNLSSAVVQKVQNILVEVVNKEVEKKNKWGHDNTLRGMSMFDSKIQEIMPKVLDLTFKLGTLDMNPALKSNYNNNLQGIKKLATQLDISRASAKEKLEVELREAEKQLNAIVHGWIIGKNEVELRKAEEQLNSIMNTIFLEAELSPAQLKMSEIKEWHFMRSRADREVQINKQQQIIDDITKRSNAEKILQTNRQQKIIDDIKKRIDAERILQKNKQQTLINEIKIKIQNAEY
jgi:hypothetical protein